MKTAAPTPTPCLGSVLLPAMPASFAPTSQGTYAETLESHFSITGGLNFKPSIPSFRCYIRRILYFFFRFSGDLCYSDKLYTTTLSPGEEFNLTLWYLKGADFSATCYGWCTEDGELPEPNGRAVNLRNILPGVVRERPCY